MTDFAELINKKDEYTPKIVTITGDAGVGKTSLAATWPRPIFIRAEDGFSVFDEYPEGERPAKFPVLNSVDDLWAQLSWLIKSDHDFKTVVIDSVTQLENMFTDAVVSEDAEEKRGQNKKLPLSIADVGNGFGFGFTVVGAMHGRLRQAAKLLVERKKMQVVFIAHSDVEKIDLPDQDPYSKYELRLNKKWSRCHYVDNVDMVAYIALETFVKRDNGTGKTKAISDGTRVAICHSGAAQVSKNRFGITEPVILQPKINPFKFIK